MKSMEALRIALAALGYLGNHGSLLLPPDAQSHDTDLRAEGSILFQPLSAAHSEYITTTLRLGSEN